MRFILRTVRLARRFAWLVVLVVMLAANVATLTVNGVAAAANGVLAAVGVSTVAARAAAAAAPSRTAVRRIARRVSARVSKGAVRNVGAVAGESLPYAGIAVVLGVTAWELSDACETMKDMAALDAAAGADMAALDAAAGADLAALDAAPEAARVCGLTVPTADEVARRIADGPRAAWDAALGPSRIPDPAPDPGAARQAGRTAHADLVAASLADVRGWLGGLFPE